ncbi:hypothetical protein B0H66DRAFT_539196 [Apodospora peruviana]|uniref:Uncharacterized protein n=1 Tax=Apodospora peruviana TaxID=516989 RepID=A0AAE0IP02_9PEZI|nr:hypothetical protein B0H66DRAFT_539196 [Apodospora peruviana]
MAPIIRPEIGWDWDSKPQNNAKNSNLPQKFFQIDYNGHALMFTVDVLGKGVQPDSKSCPMWICLHGGGTTSATNNNDEEWTSARKDLFEKLISTHAAAHGPIIMVCPRGVSTKERHGDVPAYDEYNLHFRDESYVLMEQMIIRLLRPNKAIEPYFVDPNRVFLWGFSAGGDGAFNVGARLIDRFAGVVAAAGHPNGAPFDNCANLEMLLQVGERDVLVGSGERRISRAKVYLEEIRTRLMDLQKEKGGNGSLYSYTCMVVQTETAPPGTDYFYHNSWSTDDTRTILKASRDDEATVKAWLQQNDLQGEKFKKWLAATDANRVWTTPPRPEWYNPNTTINPLQVFADKYKRNPTPNRVIWHLKARPPKPQVPGKPEEAPKGWEKRMMYWLYVRQSPLDSVAAGLVDNGAEDVSTYTSGNTRIIHVARPNSHMGYLLKESWISGGQTVTLRINVDGSIGTKDFPLGSLVAQSTIKTQTKELSGDTELEFAAMVYLVGSSTAGWSAKIAQSLDG